MPLKQEAFAKCVKITGTRLTLYCTNTTTVLWNEIKLSLFSKNLWMEFKMIKTRDMPVVSMICNWLKQLEQEVIYLLPPYY